MNKEAKAELARTRHSKFLRRNGAHAISVEQVKEGKGKTFAVVAMFDDEPSSDLPKDLLVNTDGHEDKVPLVVRREERFHLD